MASFLHPFQHCIVLLWLVWLNEFLLGAEVRSLQFPHEDCNAVSIIESKAKCRPYPAIEVMMDHITLKGKKLSTIKRLSPSHVMIHQCSGDCAGLSSLRCLPRTTEIVPVSVSVATCTEEFHCMETCTVVHLVNHTSCHCSCDQNSRTCKGGQMFLPDECRCRCPNVAEKEECERHASGKKWDPVFCRCFCPSSTFAICEENQVYDFRNECRCISRDKLWAEAGSGALKLSWEMAIIMVLSGLAFFLVTLAIVMAKKLSVLTKAGLHLPHRNSNASTAGSLSYTR